MFELTWDSMKGLLNGINSSAVSLQTGPIFNIICISNCETAAQKCATGKKSEMQCTRIALHSTHTHIYVCLCVCVRTVFAVQIDVEFLFFFSHSSAEGDHSWCRGHSWFRTQSKLMCRSFKHRA